MSDRGTWRTWAVRALLTLTASAHLWTVISIARQPLDVQRESPDRSAVFGLFNDTMFRVGPGADFFAVYRAGLQPTAEGPYRERWGVANDPPYAFPYRYLPIVAHTLGRWSNRLAPREAYLTWICVLELALLGFIGLFWWRARGSPGIRIAGTFLLLISTPFLLELHMGQFTFLSCVLTLSALVLLEEWRGRRGAMGALPLFTAAALLKVYPMVVTPVLLRHRHARSVAVGAGLALLIPAAWYFNAHPSDWTMFRDVNLAEFSPGYQTGNFGLVYAAWVIPKELGYGWSENLYPVVMRLWQVGLLGATAMLVLLSPKRLVVGGATLLCGYFLTYHHVWEHHYSAALPLGLLVLAGSIRSGTSDRVGGPDSKRTAAAIGWIALMLIALPTPFALWHANDLTWQSWPGHRRGLLSLSKSLPLLAIFVLGVVQLLGDVQLRRGARDPGAVDEVTSSRVRIGSD